MNVLDENITEEQRYLLEDWHIRVRHIGYDVGRPGLKDDEIIPLLHRLPRPTLFTRDADFYKRNLCHSGYSLVYIALGPDEAATFIRKFLRHPQFDTQAKRLGTIIRVSQVGLTVWRLHAQQAIEIAW